MKGLKVVRVFTVLITAVSLILLIPFGFFKDSLSLKFVLQFSFKSADLVPYFKIVEHIDTMFKVIQYGAIVAGGLMLFFWMFSFVKSQKAKSVFTWFGVIISIISIPVIILKMVLLNNSFGFDWVIGGTLIAFNFIDLFINVTNDVAMKLKNSMPTQVITQQVMQGQPVNATTDSYNAGELSDSLAARQRIELLKSGLSIPSYDDALEEIDATGSWNGLNMSDVKAYNIDDEIRKNEQLRSMNQYGTKNDTTSSLKN